MENKITNEELLISRYKFLKKNWWKFFGGGIIWILILILRDLFLEKKALWVACLVFYGINFIRWCMHYLLSRNYSKDEYPQVIHVYLWKYPIIKCIMILISVCVGCFYLFTGRCIGIVIYTILLCSGLDELFEYLELKRVFKRLEIIKTA